MKGSVSAHARTAAKASTDDHAVRRRCVGACVNPPRIARESVIALMTLALASHGCSEKHDQPAPLSLTGKVVAVDLKRKTISVEYDHPKLQTKQVDTAVVTDATEIQVNGVLAGLADVRVGEHVRGEVMVEGKGEQRKMRVLKMEIDRMPDK